MSETMKYIFLINGHTLIKVDEKSLDQAIQKAVKKFEDNLSALRKEYEAITDKDIKAQYDIEAINQEVTEISIIYGEELTVKYESK